MLELGVSACLLGHEVRWNGGHKQDHYLTDVLGDSVHFHPICPEVEIGLGIPRPTIRLEGHGGQRLVEPTSGRDLTPAMDSWSSAFVDAMPELDGFILKRGSPSCGPFNVRWYDGQSMGTNAVGRFSAQVLAARPLIAIIDEARLGVPDLRADFLDHALWHSRLRELPDHETSTIQAFHRDHKLTYMAHHPDAAIGRLASTGDPGYAAAAADHMRIRSTRGRHNNVMQHIAGYLTNQLDDDDRAELHDLIEDHGRGLVNQAAPLMLLQHHVRRCNVPDWLQSQTYLTPYPKEWMVRSRA